MDWQLRLQRAPGLEINEAPDGFLVYQPDRDRLHTLNASAMLVLDSCDGTRSVADLPPLLADAFGLAAPPDDDVAACVVNLLQEGLLVASRPAAAAEDDAPISSAD
jgi:hypothetical protein